ncbi:hypothetical protein GCM10027347_59200 [Larkinella harenae]
MSSANLLNSIGKKDKNEETLKGKMRVFFKFMSTGALIYCVSFFVTSLVYESYFLPGREHKSDPVAFGWAATITGIWFFYKVYRSMGTSRIKAMNIPTKNIPKKPSPEGDVFISSNQSKK